MNLFGSTTTPCFRTLLFSVWISVLLAKTSSGMTFTVTTTADSGVGSLRQAILNSNATTPGPNTIAFGIPGTSVHTITPLTVLPIITTPVLIDGDTQPGTSANTLAGGDNAVIRITINGATVETNSGGGLLHGLEIGASNCTVRGLNINNFFAQIVVSSGSGNLITGNFIGTDASGTTIPGSGPGEGTGSGVEVDSPNNTIGGTAVADRNVIGVHGNCVEISGPGTGATGTLVQGNFVGVDHTGTVGFSANAGIHDNGVNSVTIGGTVIGAGNIVSGSNGDGIPLNGSNCVIQGNFVGTDVTGTKALGNNQGVTLGGSNNLLGGTTAAARNVISGNREVGVGIGGTVTGNSVQGNYIGVDVSGTKALGNGNGGISISAASPNNNLIGGVTKKPGVPPGNVISANTNTGIVLNGTNNNKIQGNIIGADVTGTLAMGNTGDGIIMTTAVGNVIGGKTGRTANIIAFNGGSGPPSQFSGEGVHVADSPSINNSILGNSIFSNDGLGIELGDSFVNTNDPCDADSGPNNLQNYPGLTKASSDGISTTIQGTLNSKASTTFRVEFFANAVCGLMGFGEGQTFLGAANVVTNSTCNASFLVPLRASTATTVTSSLNPSTHGTPVTFTATVKSTAVVNSIGKRITATATDPSGNTSEFSACASVTQTAPTSSTPTGTVMFKDGTTVLGTGTLSSGKATFTTSTLALGKHSITAVYGGNADFAGSKSPVLTQTVNP
jgi:Bacterial Ig-like domain (group 3)